MRFYSILVRTVVLFLIGCLVLIFLPLNVLAIESSFLADKAFEHTKYIVQKIGPRPPGSKEELKAAKYISYVLDKAGWKVREQPFSKVVVNNTQFPSADPRIKLVSSQNIIAELPGKTRSTVLIGAHYDSAESSPGAIDNASGVGVLLELARVLGGQTHEQTYQLVFFGAEEAGLVGSSYFAKSNDLSAINWMLNIDMVGLPLEIDFAGKKSAPPELIKTVTSIAKDLKIPFHSSRDFMVLTRDSSQGGSSDFSSFLEQGIPAVGLGISGRPAGFYHRPEDRLEEVSLEDLQIVGSYVEKLTKEIKLSEIGPREWDEYYLAFQVHSKIFIVSSLLLRILYLAIFISTIVMITRYFKRYKLSALGILWAIGVTLLLSIIAVGFSWSGEIIWRFIKSVDFIWNTYPQIFLLFRILMATSFILFFGSFSNKLPIPRDANLYWISGVIVLSIFALTMLSIRVDLAFSFVFWLLCLNIQWFYPKLPIALIGPYFFYVLHWELLNSQQWLSFYETGYRYPSIFIVIYGLLLTPIFMAILHVICSNPKSWSNVLNRIRKHVAIGIALMILVLGLVPAYTTSYPQTITVKEEWIENGHGQISISSNDQLPKQLLKDLKLKPGKKGILPAFNSEAPIQVNVSVEQGQNYERKIDLDFINKHDPYLVRLKLESKKPFQITQLEDFVPISKLPRNVQLVSSEQAGFYNLVIEKTPPHKDNIQLVVKAESSLKLIIETTFLDQPTQLKLNGENLSVNYQSFFRTKFEF